MSRLELGGISSEASDSASDFTTVVGGFGLRFDSGHSRTLHSGCAGVKKYNRKTVRKRQGV
jgi:hypothetical protein